MRQTLARPQIVQGIGVHSGRPVRARLDPQAPGRGWWLQGRPVAQLPLLAAARCTALATPEGPIYTVEHLFAALQIARIDDVQIWVEGGELPILDGSASGWLPHLDPVAQPGERVVLRLDGPVQVGAGARTIVATPARSLVLSVLADHGAAGPYGAQRRWQCVVSLAGARAALAPARTYGFERDARALRAQGLAQGAGLENTLILDDWGRSALDQPWRLDNEPARHKALDLLGDLGCVGLPVHAHIWAQRPGHALNAALVQRLRERLAEVTLAS